MPFVSSSLCYALEFLNLSSIIIIERKAYLFRCFTEFEKAFPNNSSNDFASSRNCGLLNARADDWESSKRHCGRIKLNFLMISDYKCTESSQGSRKRQRADLHIDASDVDEVWAPKMQAPTIIFNFEGLFSRREHHSFPVSSFVFFGSFSDGFLNVLALQRVNEPEKAAIHQAVVAMLEQVDRLVTSKDVCFAGFSLSNSANEIDNYCKALLQKFTPIIMHLNSSPSKADWFLGSDRSSAIKLLSIVPGFVLHDPSSPVQDDCVAFFPKKIHHVTAVDPDTLKEKRLPRFHSILSDTKIRHSVPICKSRIEQQNLESLFQEDLSFKFAEVSYVGYIHNVMCYVDPRSAKIWYFCFLLSASEMKSLRSTARFKSDYCRTMSWILSRIGAITHCSWSVKESILAACTFEEQGWFSFMLNDIPMLQRNDREKVIDDFYKDCSSTKDLQELVRKLIQQYRYSQKKIMIGRIRDVQRLSLHAVSQARSQCQIFPTLEFYNNSCWLECAINCLLSVPLALLRIPVYTMNVSINCLDNMFKTMCFFASAGCLVLPVLELQRCGIYPLKAEVAPLVLGDRGYALAQFAPHNAKAWGSYGSVLDSFEHFTDLLRISSRQRQFLEMKAVMNLEQSDVVIINWSESAVHNTEMPPEDEHAYRLCAVAFTNNAHWYSVVKNRGVQTWTLKDALTSRLTVFDTFTEAFKASLSLHAHKGYFVGHVIYYRRTSVPEV